MTTEFVYDAFISYSHDDKEWVRNTLLPYLEGRGFKIAIDFRDFRPASNLVDEIERCVVASKHVVTVLTPRYLESDWTTFERVMTRTVDPSARKRKLIPIMRKDTSLPLSIRMLIYVDLRKDDDFEQEKLIQALN